MLKQFRHVASNLPRYWKQFILLTFDAFALVFVLWLSYSLRLGGRFVPNTAQLLLMVMAPVIALPVFVRFGLYRAVIRYLPERAIWTILRAMSLATVIWVALLFLAEMSRLATVPRSIPAFYWFFGTIVIAGSRFLAKAMLWIPSSGDAPPRDGEVVIYGAGSAGIELASALRSKGARYVAGFLDDNLSLQGHDVSGIRVYSPDYLGELISKYGVREVIISMPSIDAATRQTIINKLSVHPVKIRTLPAISDLVRGKYLVNQLREIDIDDLLGRSSVPADPELLRRMLLGRVVLVSGAGGSIGSELARLIARWSPQKLVLLEANEFALYEIERAISGKAEFPIVPVLGSVEDDKLVRRTIATHDVKVLFHAAAHKHVPLVEANALEGVRNNVFGTATIARAALDGGVENFVLISTDKAVRPTSVMGATKRWAELIVRANGAKADAAGTGQKFCSVRFGNVLGSNGSVVPLFNEQIANGGPVTVTHDDMTRYFMSIHEAAELIVQAGALSEGGDIFLLEMGKPVRIRDLAENMIRLAGLSIRSPVTGSGDIEIAVIGPRPGEKITEELFYDPSLATPTAQPKILRATRGERTNGDLERAMSELEAALLSDDEARLRKVLFAFVRE
jgi:FlaA1/EpsC-like NDP-sugar epimerase